MFRSQSPHPSVAAPSGTGQPLLARFARSRVAAPVLLLAICCTFCWKLVLSRAYTWIDNPDAVHMDVPRLQFQLATWTGGHFPLWDPHLWCGQPFLGQIVGAAYPLTWPLFLLPSGAAQKISLDALNWYFVLLHFLTAWAAYALCRELRISRLPSILGGFAYSFSGIAGATLWPEVLGSILLAPLVFLYLFRALDGQRAFGSAALCGVFLGATWLAGHHEVPVYLATAVGCIWAVEFCRAPLKRRATLGLAATAAAFTVLTSGFQTIPGYEYARLAVRWVGIDHPVVWGEAIPYRIHEGFSLAPNSILAMIVARTGGGSSELFAGICVLALAAIAICTGWRRKFVPLLTCLAVASLFFAFGGSNLLHGIAYSVLPIFGKARTPLRILSVFSLAIAVLAAAGLDLVVSGAWSNALLGVRRALLAFGCGILAIALAASALGGHNPHNAFYIAALCALGLACVLSATRAGSVSTRVLRVSVMLLVLFEAGNYFPACFRERTAPKPAVLHKLAAYQDIAEYLRRQPGPTRVHLDNEAFNFGDWEGIDMLTGFGAGVTANILGLDWPQVRTQNLLAVQYTLTKQPPRPDQEIVFQGRDGVHVLRNRDALPRVRIVHRAERAASAVDVRKRIEDTSFDASGTALLTAPPPALETCGDAGRAAILSRTANSAVIQADMPCRGMLILADTWYPGWTAEVDGRPAPVHQAYAALRGVVLESGSHRVVFRYRPASVWIGAVCSLVGILGACSIALLGAIRRPSRPAKA